MPYPSPSNADSLISSEEGVVAGPTADSLPQAVSLPVSCDTHVPTLRTYRRLSQAPYARVRRGMPCGGPPFPETIEFGIGGDANFRCLEGLLALFSLFLVELLSRSQFLPMYPTTPYP